MEYDRKHIVKMWALILQVGLSAIAPIILCVGVAIYLRDSYDIDYVLVLSILGILSGFTAAFRMAASQIGEDSEEVKLLTGIYDRKGEPCEDEDIDDILAREYEELNQRREE